MLTKNLSRADTGFYTLRSADEIIVAEILDDTSGRRIALTWRSSRLEVPWSCDGEVDEHRCIEIFRRPNDYVDPIARAAQLITVTNFGTLVEFRLEGHLGEAPIVAEARAGSLPPQRPEPEPTGFAHAMLRPVLLEAEQRSQRIVRAAEDAAERRVEHARDQTAQLVESINTATLRNQEFLRETFQRTVLAADEWATGLMDRVLVIAANGLIAYAATRANGASNSTFLEILLALGSASGIMAGCLWIASAVARRVKAPYGHLRLRSMLKQQLYVLTVLLFAGLAAVVTHIMASVDVIR